MNIIGGVEDDMVSQIDTAFSRKLRAVESIGGPLTFDFLRKKANVTPACYVGFLGAKSGSSTANSVVMNGVFTVYVLTDHASGNEERRRGDNRQIGSDDIINTVVSLLHGHAVKDVGTLQAKRIDNLFTVQIDKLGVAVYAIVFEAPLPFYYEAVESSLDDFITYEATHCISTDTDIPVSNDELTLDQ